MPDQYIEATQIIRNAEKAIDRKNALLERCLEFLLINEYEIDLSLLVDVEKELGKES